MALEVVEGILQPSQPKSNRRGYGLFPELTIISASGQARVFNKVATGEPVTSAVIAGGQGRYYFQRAGGALGLIGVRRPDGTSNYGHYTNLAPLVLVVGALGVLVGVARFAFGIADLPLTPAVLGPLLLLFGAYLNSQKNAARRAFEADGTSAA